MKKLYLFAASALCLAFVSCQQKNDLLPEIPQDAELVGISLEVNTESVKAYIDEDKSIKWHAGDKLAVYDGVAVREFTDETLADGASSAVFSGEVSAKATELIAVYPYSAASVVDGKLKVELPENQAFSRGNVADGGIVAIGKVAADKTLSLKTAVGFAKITVTYDNINSITLVGNRIAGKVELDAQSAALKESESASGTVKVTSGSVIAKGTYYIPVWPGTTPAEGFKVQMSRADGFTTELVAASEFSIAANRPNNFGELDHHVKTFWKLDIGTKEELLAWNANYASWKANDVVTLTAAIDLAGETWDSHDFPGTFDGAGFSITGFAQTTENGGSLGFFKILSGTLKNLTVQGSLNYKADADATSESAFDYVALVSAVSGEGSIENVTSNLTVKVEENAERVYKVRAAGLCGSWSSTGHISGCTNEGSITFGNSNPAGNINCAIAGLVANVNVTGGTFENLTNKGAITANSPIVTRVAGVVGALEKVITVSNCDNTAKIAAVYTPLAGSVPYIAGVAGSVAGGNSPVTDCDNSGEVSISLPAETVTGAEVNVAGIAGLAKNGTFTNCTNTAKIQLGSSTEADNGSAGAVINAGGIVAKTDAGKPNFISCVHSGEVNLYLASSASANIGGVAGLVGTESKFDGCKSYGGRVVSGAAAVNAVNISLGGVAGYVSGAASFISCSNEKNGTAGATADLSKQSTQVYLGGIAAFVEGAAKFEGCSNDINIKKATNVGKGVTIGGIVGYNKTAAITVTNCHNTEKLHCNTANSAANIGGIVGNIYGVTSSIEDCSNSGLINNNGVNTAGNGLRLGGIVGGANGITVKNCVNTASVTNTANNTSNVNHWLGGIIGLNNSAAATIENCTVFGSTISYTGTNTNAKLGILAAVAIETNLKNNKVNGTVGGTELTTDNFKSYLTAGTKTPVESGTTYISALPSSLSLSVSSLHQVNDVQAW
ncbi:MAG: hypothetical protein ACI3ZK_07215 [Candidatus Cryptobacteroides sp.]